MNKKELPYKLIIMDVDGTLTDAGIYYDENGNELKKFCTKDAAGIFVASYLGIKTMIVTGRECAATTRRMQDMHVDYVFQNIREKRGFIQGLMKDNGYDKEEVIYIGDDLNDLPAMDLAGYVGCPADSCTEVRNRADYVSPVSGGHGAVRDVVEHVLHSAGLWTEAAMEVYSKQLK